MIEIKNLTKSFNGRAVLKEITLHIAAGKITGIMGANGSGKTTLLRLISTILKPDCGELYIDGIDAVKKPGEARKHFGVLFGGDTALYNKLTAYENIAFQAQLQGIDTRCAEVRIKKFASHFNMDSYINRETSGFSRGMRQKLSFARAVIHNPSLLLLDEPSTGLDIDSILEIHSLIKDFKKNGKTVVITSHNMNELEKLCDNIVLINNGKIAVSGNVFAIKKATTSTSIEDIYRFYVTKR